MKFKIEKDGYDRYRVYRRFLGCIWINIHCITDTYLDYYMYLEYAENSVRRYCAEMSRLKTKTIKVKEIDCKDIK